MAAMLGAEMELDDLGCLSHSKTNAKMVLQRSPK